MIGALIGRYVVNLGILVSQILNTVLLFGDPDETVSSRAGKNREKPGWRELAAALDWFFPGHTSSAREDDEGARQIGRD